MQGIGTDETTLVEILTTRTNAEINEIKKRYKEGKYGYTTERMSWLQQRLHFKVKHSFHFKLDI